MKQSEINQTVERVVETLRPQLLKTQATLDRLEGVIHGDRETLLRAFTAMEDVLRAIPPRFERLDHNITGIHSCLERLERILEARATKVSESEDISRITEAMRPKSLPDQVDEIKALCDKLNLTIVQKE